MNKWLNFKQLLLSLVLPQNCLLCDTRVRKRSNNIALCAACLADLPWHNTPQCPQCALPTTNNELCGDCIQSPPAFDATHTLFRYAYPIDKLITRYKYASVLSIGDTFAALLTAKLLAEERQNAPMPTVLIPMPLHPARLRERGFNQSLEIAKIIAKNTNYTLDNNRVKRIKLTPPQAALPLKERVKNMRGAFDCAADFTGTHIVLMDDVMTTGASLHELAKTLKKAGAKRVECWVIARTLPR